LNWRKDKPIFEIYKKALVVYWLPFLPLPWFLWLWFGLALEKKVGRGGLMAGGYFFCWLGLAEHGG
jgi:hypothetical protein